MQFQSPPAISVEISDLSIGHLTVVCEVTWPWILSEAGGDLVLIQTTLLFIRRSYCSYANYLHLHVKSDEVCAETRATLASLRIQDRVTKHTTVKWPINNNNNLLIGCSITRVVYIEVLLLDVYYMMQLKYKKFKLKWRYKLK